MFSVRKKGEASNDGNEEECEQHISASSNLYHLLKCCSAKTVLCNVKTTKDIKLL